MTALNAQGSGLALRAATFESSLDDVLRNLLEGTSPSTRRAYDGALRAYSAWLSATETRLARAEDPGAPAVELDVQAALAATYTLDVPAAYRTVLQWVQAQQEDGKAPRTIHLRVTALRQAVRVGRSLGMTQLAPDDLKVRLPRIVNVRETEGPTPHQAAAMLRAAADNRDPVKAARDHAILALLTDVSLRRGELSSLNVADFEDGEPARLMSVRKGQRNRQPSTMPDETAAAVRAWLAVHPTAADPTAPMFVGLAHTSSVGCRLSGNSIYRVCRRLGKLVGVQGNRGRPHALRHAVATAAANLTNGDIVRVQRYLRHESPTTTSRYIDAAKDDRGEVSKAVARHLRGLI